METLKGKQVLITGATGGIGSRVAKLISSNGATVFITGREANKLQQVARDAGIAAERALVMDICNETSVNQAVGQVLASSNQWTPCVRKNFSLPCKPTWWGLFTW